MVNPQTPLYLTTLTVIANIVIHLWLIVPIFLNGGKIYMANDWEPIVKGLTKRQASTLTAIDITNKIFGEQGYDDISDFMRGIASAETQLGKLQSDVSYSPFQIDPIRYDDIVQRTQDDPSTPDVVEGGAALKRANTANELLRSVGFGEDFDILDLSENKDEIRNPLVGALLTRMALANIPKDVPTELHNINPETGKREKGVFTDDYVKEKYGSWKNVPDKYLGKSGYWKKYWNTGAGAGKPEHYVSQKNYFDSLLDLKAHDNTVLE